MGIRYLVNDKLTLDSDHLTTLYQKRWGVKVYDKPLKQNTILEKSPTRTPMTQRNHLFASLCAYVKLKPGLNHFAMRSKIYLSGLQAAFIELGKLKLQSFIT